jgi:hypothetical protein
MVLIAKKDTYAIESVGGGVDVRRRVVAGQEVAPWWEIDADAVEEVDPAGTGLAFYQSEQITMRVDMDDQGDIVPTEPAVPPGEGEEEGEEGSSPHAAPHASHARARSKRE